MSTPKVTATEIAKMVFCEANVVNDQQITLSDRKRMAEGELSHIAFERRMRESPRIPLKIEKEAPRSAKRRTFAILALMIVFAVSILLTE